MGRGGGHIQVVTCNISVSVPSDEMGHLAVPSCVRGWESSYPRVTFRAENGEGSGSRRTESFPGASGIKNSPAM